MAIYPTFAQTKSCGSTYYSSIYKPNKIDSLQQLPKNIQTKLISNLKNYLGNEFFKLLRFNGGLVINYNALVNADSNVKKYKWKVPTYDLSFFIIQKKAGIEYCCSHITLDELGNIIEQIEFPKKQSNNITNKFLAKEEILNTAEKAGFSVETYDIICLPDKIIFRFNRLKGKDIDQYLDINIHTGETNQQFESQRMY